MINYIKRNPLGNAIIIGIFAASLVISQIDIGRFDSKIPVFIITLLILPCIVGLVGSLSFFIIKSGNITNSESERNGFYELKLETFFMTVLGLLSVFIMFLAGYYSYNVEPAILIALVGFPSIVFTRQWSFNKRLTWFIVYILIIIFILISKPNLY